MPRLINATLAKEIRDAFVELSDSDEIRVRSYSGRAMYNRECLGIVGEISACDSAIAEVIDSFYDKAMDACVDASAEEEHRAAHILRDTASDVLHALIAYRSDQMGRQMVYYWPDIPYTSDE